jgi:hypothetical protein
VFNVIFAVLISDVGNCCRLEVYRVVIVSLRDLSLPLFDVNLGATVTIL